MSYIYSNPRRENDPHAALPDIEVFQVDSNDWNASLCPLCGDDCNGESTHDKGEHDRDHIGWYWQAGFPGCLPDGEPNGPFETEAEAIADAQDDPEVQK